ncbi:hypothetical protein B0H13DRAFT_1932763 [Mycena leptocephala]|nr:hypothetical protein B0H13DRAFT_1932763 [Mycena leptocephala]
MLMNPCLQLPMDVDPQSQDTLDVLATRAERASELAASPVTNPAPTHAPLVGDPGTDHNDAGDDAMEGVHHESGDAHTPAAPEDHSDMTLCEAEDRAMEGQVPEYLDMYLHEAGEGMVQLIQKARSDLVVDSPSEDDDEDSAEVQARAYDQEHYKMEVVQEEWDNILMSSVSTSHRRLPALPSCSPTPQHRLDPLVTDAAHPQTRGHTPEDVSVDWDEKCGGEGDPDTLVEDPSEALIRAYQQDDLRGDAMVLWMPFTPPGFLAKPMTVAPERDQTPLLPDASSRRAPLPARDTSVAAAGDKTPLFLPDDSSTCASSPEAEAPPTADFIRWEEDDEEHDDHRVIPSDVAKFFDLDAQDADSEEDEPETPADKALPSLGDPELYVVKVLPGTEYAFLVWLYGLVPNDAIHPHIVSAFHRPDSPGLTKTLYWALRNQLGVRVLDIVPVAQWPMLLDLPETGPHLGWGRIVDKHRYDGDLVLITCVNTGLVVPRIKAVKDEQEDAMRASHQMAGSRKVDQGNVRPTEAELDFFRQVHIPEVDLRDPSFPTLALAEGDRFVTKSSGPGRTSGYILAIHQVGAQRMAACREHFNGTQRLAKQHVERYIPVHALDHHILRIPHLLEPLDRVIVVDGVGEMGQVGRIIDIAPDGIVTFQPVESPPSKAKDKTAVSSTTQNTPVSLPMADLSICFQCGDWVEVTRRPRAQQKGFIISLRAGGVAEVYDPNRPKINALTLETIQYDHGDLTCDPNRMNDINLVTSQTADPFFIVPTHSLKFAYRVDKMLADWGGVMPQPGTRLTETITNDPVLMTIVTSNMAMKDKTMRDYITKNVYTGNGFEGREVRVIGGKKVFKGNNYKGCYGFVVGGVLVVQKGPNKNSKDWESLETQVKKMPLVQTAYVEWEGPLRERTPSPPPSRSPVWTGPDVPRDPAEQRALDAASAESNGEWLTQIELVDKCVDIVVDTLVITPYWHANWSQAASNANGRSGYVIIPPNFKYKTKKANTKLGLPLKNVGIPVNNLRPQRTMYDLHIHEGRESIAAVEVRVIIIGPDVNGDKTHLGEYAQTMPSEHADPNQVKLTDVVRVKFAVTPLRVEPGEGLFPLYSLCRSLNKQSAGITQNMTSDFVRTPWATTAATRAAFASTSRATSSNPASFYNNV